MDLSTIKKNLNKSKYKSIDAFLADLDLIWSNCKDYNQVESPIYEQAVIMEKYFIKSSEELRKEWAKMKQSDDTVMEEEDKMQDGGLSYDEKLLFTNAIKKLSVSIS
jgi:hypothetical protein